MLLMIGFAGISAYSEIRIISTEKVQENSRTIFCVKYSALTFEIKSVEIIRP